MILCVAGNPAVDKLFEVERLAPGEIHRPLGFIQRPGGKGLNVARAATSLGARASVTGLVGGHSGRWIAAALASEPVEGRFAPSSAETRTCLSVADRETGRLTEFYEAGAPVTHAEWDGLMTVATSLMAGAAWMTVSGSLPAGAPAGGYRELVHAARDAGVPAALDSRGPALAAGLAARPAMVKVNAAEAAELLGAPVGDAATAVAAGRTIRRRIGGDGHAAAITLGERGAVLIDPAGDAHQGSLDVRGAYPVASGDAFLAGLVVALERAEPWPEAMRLALGAAAANAEVPGAGVLDGARAHELAAAAVITAG